MHARLQGEATKCLKTRLCGESHAAPRVVRFGAFLGHLCAFSGRLCPKLIVSGCHVRPFSVLDFFGRHPHMGEGVQYLEEGGLQHPRTPNSLPTALVTAIAFAICGSNGKVICDIFG